MAQLLPVAVVVVVVVVAVVGSLAQTTFSPYPSQFSSFYPGMGSLLEPRYIRQLVHEYHI